MASALNSEIRVLTQLPRDYTRLFSDPAGTLLAAPIPCAKGTETSLVFLKFRHMVSVSGRA